MHASIRQLCLTAMALWVCACGGGDGNNNNNNQDPRLETLVLSVPKTSLAVNETVALEVSGKDQNGDAIDTGTVTWSSSDSARATVNAQGEVTGKGRGGVTITAAAGGKTATVSLTVAGALHSSNISANETWREADSPHVVTGAIYVGGSGGPVLTIEAGVEVRFEANASLDVGSGEGGGIVINGTQARPVKFTANTATPSKGYWNGITLNDQATSVSSISHTTFEYCGGGSAEGCVQIWGANVKPSIQNVTIRQSATNGISLDFEGAFGANSSNLTVTEAEGAAMWIDPNQVGSIPAGGSFTGNGRSVIRVRQGNVTKTQTWKNLGVPYVIDGTIYVGGSGTPTLTLQPRLTLRFASNSHFFVGSGEAGILKALGAAGEEILFTADSDTPTAGHWWGITFGAEATSANQLDYVVVEYAGRDNGSTDEGAIVVQNDKGSFITHTTIRYSGDCGFLREDYTGGGFATDFTASSTGNTFENNAGADQCGP